MPDLDTAEYRKLALIAAGVPLGSIPPIIDTATWRKMMIAALLQNTANQAISGSVDYYSQLPVTVGSPGIGTTYLVLNSSGVYYINYKSAGVYVKLTDTGSLSDWVYAPLSAIGTLPDVTLTNQQVGDALTWNGSRWVNAATTLVSSFTTAGNFLLTIPSNARSVDVICIGGGGGGGGGTRTGGGPFAYGGSGGGGGGMSMYSFRMPSASDLSCNITVGSGGGGGTVGGGSASSGGSSFFSAQSGIVISALGGLFGQNGGSSIPPFGGAGGVGMFSGGEGIFYNGSVPSPVAGAGGGGSGGGVSGAGTLPSSSGTIPVCVYGTSPVSENNVYPGGGGSGGSGSVNGTPQAGTNGRSYGGGGGGGGSTISGSSTPAKGGNGSSGAVIVIQHF